MRARRLLTPNGYTLAEVLVVLIILGILIGIGATFFFGAQKSFEDDNAKQVLSNVVTSALKSAQSNGATLSSAQNENTFPSFPSLISDMTPEHSNKIITGAGPTATNNQAKGTVVIDTVLSGPRHIVLYTQTPEGHIWEVAADTDGLDPKYARVDQISAPQNAGPPQIIGDPFVGNTLTLDPGAWLTGGPLTYSYQWRRCDTSGANCVDIAGANGSTYVLTSSDLGTTLRVVVTATNSGGSANSTSDKTGVVVRSANSGPENTNKPTITGIPAEKQTLHNDNPLGPQQQQQGSWTGRAPITLARQWQRCDTTGQNCVDISGATASTYLLQAADIGSTVRVNVIATDSNGTNTAASDVSGVITMALPENTALPAISGSAIDAHLLTASNGSWTSSGPLTYAYQWRRCDNSGANCADINGANASTYMLQSADIGSTIRVIVAATNAGGPTAATSPQTAVVQPDPPNASPGPAVSGTAREGQTLTGDDGSWTGTAPVSKSRQWRRCDSSGASCVDIGGATGVTYVLVAADIGKTIRFQVAGTNVAGTTTLVSSATNVIQAAPPAGGTVSISGPPVVGQTLTANPSGWTSSVSITYTYQWRSCDSAGANCTDMAGQTASTYSPTTSDLGTTIRVFLTATNSGGAGSATSAATSLISRGAPVGTVVAYTGTSSLPTGWAVADGSCGYSSTANSDLYGVIGTTYGGTASSFCLPDMRGRMPLGKAASGTGSTLGATGGALSQSGASTPWGAISTPFSWTETPPTPPGVSHSHDDNEPYGANYWISNSSTFVNTYVSLSPNTETFSPQGVGLSASGTATPTVNYTVSNPPYRVIRYIIATALGAVPPCGALWANAAATPSGAQLADGSNASGVLTSCLDPAFSGKLPDLRGAIPTGQAGSGVAATLGASGGALSQTLSGTLNAASTQETASPSAWTAYVVEGTHYHSANYSTFGQPTNGGSTVFAAPSAPSVSANSDAGSWFSSNAFSPGTLTATGSGTQSQTSSAFTTAFETFNWVAYTSSGYSLAPGTITPYAGSSAPTSWLMADGSCYSTTGSYANLFGAIGYTYGGSGGSFCVPDLRGRFPLGVATSGTGSSLGASGGTLSPSASLPFSGWTPSITIPAHTFTWSIPAHYHTIGPWGGGGAGQNCSCGNGAFSARSPNARSSSWAGGGTVSSSIGQYTVNGPAVGGANVTPVIAPPPFTALNMIIYTG